ncbi:MAG: hypothetical protein OEM00_09390, partial [Burkholderiaceae bacterium]|nr:hypothetical protein [Burkholderiaceae bacterium]
MKALQAAEARKDGLATLRQQSRQAASEALSLQAAVAATRKVWQGDRLAGVEAAKALEQAADCLPEVRSKLKARAQSLAQLERARAQSLQAVQVVAKATADSLPSATSDSDAAFSMRAAAEQTQAARQRALVNQANDCLRLVSSADSQIDQAFESRKQLGQQASVVATQSQRLRTQWDQAASAYRAASQAQWLDAPVPALVLPPDDRIALLEQSLSSTPTRTAPADLGALQMFAGDDKDEHHLSLLLARLQDSVTYIDLAVGPHADTCVGAGCPSFAAERRELTRRMVDVRAALEAARARAAIAETALDTLLVPLQTALQAHAESTGPVARALPAALDDASNASHAVGAAAEAIERSTAAAFSQAMRDWQAAHRLAYGKPPVQTTTPAVDPPKPADSPEPTTSPRVTPKVVPQLRSHAYELFNGWDAEPQGFGAYTYVLLRSADDLKTPAVRRRFMQLLTTLQKLPAARLVSAEDARHVNLFCIPGTTAAGTGNDKMPVVYASDLGQQLKLRAQNGLLTRREVSRRMIDSPGPFLITLPGRIAQVPSSAPLLFADLSAYPDDAIADLASNYMNGLVDDFPSQQRLWTPPLLQRVALVMIHLASGAGEVMTSV